MKDNHSLASFLFRISFSIMMLTHGYGKLMKLLSGDFGFANPIGIGELPTLIFAVIAEFVCPILIIIGWKTRLVAIPPAIVMLVAIFLIHWSDPWKNIEFPLLYLTGFIGVYLLGSGTYSLDWRLKKV